MINMLTHAHIAHDYSDSITHFFIYSTSITLSSIMYSNIYSVEDCHHLQNYLDSLKQWSHKWLITLNPKSEFLFSHV